MHFRWLVTLAALLAFFSMPAQAGLTRLELKQKTDAHTSWTVDAPIKDVFAAYEEYVNTHFSVHGFLWAKGSETLATLDETSGEITTRLIDNPFGKGVHYLIELHSIGEQTRVDYYFANGHWRRNGEKLRDLFPPMAAP